MGLMSSIRKFFGLASKGATPADQAMAESDNALREVTESMDNYRATNQKLTESHQELRKIASSLDPFLQAEKIMREGPRRRRGPTF